MRKFTVVAIALMVGVSLAYASSLGIPWFVDNAAPGSGIPGDSNGVTGIVTLKSNVPTEITCYITYYNQAGAELGPFPPNNSFTIDALSSLAFRPVVHDPGGVIDLQFLIDNGIDTNGDGTINDDDLVSGQEGFQGLLVPNRPRSVDNTTPIPGTNPPVTDRKKNGSIVIEWIGGTPQDVQGQIAYYQTTIKGSGETVTMSYAHLLPPGL